MTAVLLPHQVADFDAARKRAIELDAARRLLPIDLPADPAAARRLVASSWFLVRNDGGARRERIRCARCNGLHAHVTWCCRPRPFRGLDAALYVVSEIRAERARLAPVRGAEDLARSHPFTFGRRVRAGSGDQITRADRVGAIEPITPAQARTLTELIRQRDASFDPMRE